MLEVKWKDGDLSPDFEVFNHIFPQAKIIQVIKELIIKEGKLNI